MKFDFSFLFREPMHPTCYYTQFITVVAPNIHEAWKRIDVNLAYRHTDPGDLIQINLIGVKN